MNGILLLSNRKLGCVAGRKAKNEGRDVEKKRKERRKDTLPPFGLLLCQHIKSERDCVCDRDEMDGEQENTSKHYAMHPCANESESTCFLQSQSFYNTAYHSILVPTTTTPPLYRQFTSILKFCPFQNGKLEMITHNM